MHRRKFIRQSTIFAIGIGAFANISRYEERFIGDSPTTTDILGPFYRPGAPFRTNLNPADFHGDILHLSGTIFRDDERTPLQDCLVEIWQCKQDQLYDNVSDDFSYRASQKTNASGKYKFITAIPIPYPNDENPDIFRPAHIHMRISAKDQQDLITQIYLKNDPYLDTDPSTKSALSINRILSLKRIKEKETEVNFDIVLKKEYMPDDSVFHKIEGVYKMNDNSMMEFYREGDLLFWKWNHVLRGGLSYKGENTFIGGVNDTEARFELQPKGNAKLIFRFSRRKQISLEGNKILQYS